MKLDIRPLVDPMDAQQIATLTAYGRHDAATLAKIDARTVAAPTYLAWTIAEQQLVARGFLVKPKTDKFAAKIAPWRYLVTPEGLAALLDTVPIEDLAKSA